MELVVGNETHSFAYMVIGGNFNDHSGYLKLYDADNKVIKNYTGLGGLDNCKFKNEPIEIVNLIEAHFKKAVYDDEGFAVGAMQTVQYTKSGESTDTVSYVWMDNDGVIEDATAATYVPTVDQYGQKIRCYVTGSGMLVGSVMAETDAIVGGLVSATITGTAKVGETLTVTPATSPASSGNPTYSYMWFRGDAAVGSFGEIEGVTSATYVCAPIDEGKYIKAQIIASGDAIGVALSDVTEAVIA